MIGKIKLNKLNKIVRERFLSSQWQSLLSRKFLGKGLLCVYFFFSCSARLILSRFPHRELQGNFIRTSEITLKKIKSKIPEILFLFFFLTFQVVNYNFSKKKKVSEKF